MVLPQVLLWCENYRFSMLYTLKNSVFDSQNHLFLRVVKLEIV